MPNTYILLLAKDNFNCKETTTSANTERIQKLRRRQLAFFSFYVFFDIWWGFAAFIQIHLQIQIVGSKIRIQFSVIRQVRYFISVVVWTSIYYCRLRMCFWRKCEHSSQSSISLVSGLGQSWFPASLKVPFPSFPASANRPPGGRKCDDRRPSTLQQSSRERPYFFVH